MVAAFGARRAPGPDASGVCAVADRIRSGDDAEHLKAAHLSVVDVGALLDAVAATAEPVKLAYLWRPTLPDVDDDMVLEAAVNGRADGIVTFNLRDFRRAAEQFGILALSPGDAVRHLEKRS